MDVITAATAFVITNIDDLLMLMLLFAQATTPACRRNIWLGQTLGISILTAVSLAGALGLGLLPHQYLRWLGLIPIGLAVAMLRGGEEEAPGVPHSVWSVTLLTLSCGGDNVGVYVPLFAGGRPAALVMVAVLFLALTALWCAGGQRLARLPRVSPLLRRHSRWLVPVVFVALGVKILLELSVF